MADDNTLVKLAKSASIVLLATIFGRVLGFISEIIILRSLSPNLFGKLSLSYTIVASVATLALLGINEGVTRLYSAEDSTNKRARIALAGMMVVLLGGTVASVTLYMTRSTISSFMDESYLLHYLPLFLPYLVFFPLSKVTYGTLQAQKRTMAAVVSQQFGGRALAFTILVVLVVIGKEATGAIIYWISFPLITVMLGIIFLGKNMKMETLKQSLPKKETLSSLWKFSWPLALGNGVFLLLSNFDVLMIGYFLSSQEVGVYRSVQPLKQIATFAMSSVAFLFLPLATEYFEEDKTEELDRLFTSTTKWILFVTLPPMLLFGLYPSVVISTLFGESYVAASPVLTILMFGLLFRTITGLNGSVVSAIDSSKIELVSAIPGLIVNFCLNIVLIPIWGISGAAIATIFGYLVYNGVEILFIQYYVQVHPFSGDILKFSIVMIFGSIIFVRLIPSPDGILDLITVGAVLLSIQPLVLLATKSVSRSDIELVEEIESKMERNLEIITRILERGI